MADRKSAHTTASVSWGFAAVASFVGAFFLIERALAFVGVALSEANGAGFVAGLSIAGLVIVSRKVRASQRP